MVKISHNIIVIDDCESKLLEYSDMESAAELANFWQPRDQMNSANIVVSERF